MSSKSQLKLNFKIPKLATMPKQRISPIEGTFNLLIHYINDSIVQEKQTEIPQGDEAFFPKEFLQNYELRECIGKVVYNLKNQSSMNFFV